MPTTSDNGSRCVLRSPALAPQADAFLWNRRMMIQATCRGFAVAQFMQPEPAKYAHAPTLAGTSFMQPEQPYYAHHPGRFVYVRDNESGNVFSAPYEPVRAPLDAFAFSLGIADIRWLAEKEGLEIQLELSLAEDEVMEIWRIAARNRSDRRRKLSVAPYFPVGYSSWMNMSAEYSGELNGVVASRVAPYQKVDDYFKRRDWKDLTYLVSDRTPDSWEANQHAFEGEGGLARPDGLATPDLACGDARYEMPACILGYRLELDPGETAEINLLFGPAKDREEIAGLRRRFFAPDALEAERRRYAAYIASGSGCLQVETPDEDFDRFVNQWLPRQVFYHGDTNRLTTDPQTRNYLQDAMGMVYIRPDATRQALLTALSQQASSGEMPDGILIHPEAELKYINQIPHTDHGVWIVICLQAYLDETDDQALLTETLPFKDGEESASVFEHVCRALEWLIQARDDRGLSYIAQGDWCDPMNMVGYKGRGVSGWLTQALSYALQIWAPFCSKQGKPERAERYLALSGELNESLNRHLWDGAWYARGITDDDVAFGIASDSEGRIFLNTQSWALLCGAADQARQERLLQAVDEQLMTPFGPMLFAPAYTAMRDDVGRVTQKFPGSAENGSVYNHAAAFYAAALYHSGQVDTAFQVLRRMIPGSDEAELRTRNQLPVYIPNYYRGAFHQIPRTAGRSSRLFNTGTASWYYRLVVEQLFGLRGEGLGLRLNPQLPSHWSHARASRRFRGATIKLRLERRPGLAAPKATLAGQPLPELFIPRIHAGSHYEVHIALPG